jgi:hypothetical protein
VTGEFENLQVMRPTAAFHGNLPRWSVAASAKKTRPGQAIPDIRGVEWAALRGNFPVDRLNDLYTNFRRHIRPADARRAHPIRRAGWRGQQMLAEDQNKHSEELGHDGRLMAGSAAFPPTLYVYF